MSTCSQFYIRRCDEGEHRKVVGGVLKISSDVGNSGSYVEPLEEVGIPMRDVRSGECLGAVCRRSRGDRAPAFVGGNGFSRGANP